MTTNAGHDYFKAKEKYEQATTRQEKLLHLQEMYRFAPKHKSSEKMVAELTGKIARLKKEMEKERLQAKKTSGHSINVKKEGCGQIAILGMPNTGKSTLLKQLTGVNVEVAPYPFTTSLPEVGMMNYKGAKVQLVEVPAIIEGSSGGKANGTQLLSVARNADAIIIMHRALKEKNVVAEELKRVGIMVSHAKPKIAIKPSEFKGITVSGKQHLKMTAKEFERALKSFGIHNASVLLEEATDLEKLSEALDDSLDYKKCLFLKTMELPKEDKLRKDIFSLLEKIVIYTKKPGQEPDYDGPLVLKRGSTIANVAEFVHKDIARNLKFARVWGSTKFPGQRVSRNYELKSEDIVEIS